MTTEPRPPRSPLVWHVGGEDTHRRIPLLRRLKEAGFRVGAVGSQDPAPFVRAGIDYRRYALVRHTDPLADLRTISELRRLFADGRPDIVHAFDTKPAIYAMLAARSAGVRGRVRTITGLGYLHSEDSLKTRALRPVYLGLHRLAGRAASWTIFQNEDDRAFFTDRRLIPADRGSVVLGSGIDIAETQAAVARGPSPEEARRSLGIGSRPTALMAARLVRQKGVLDYIAAAQKVKQHEPAAELLLAGPIEDETLRGVGDPGGCGAVRYLGERNDLLSLMAAVDVVVLPSYYREGIPRVLLEAAAVGVPIVTTDVPGCREAVVPGSTGWSVPPRDPAALADAIMKALALTSPQRKALADAARDLVRRCFDLSIVAERYAEIYRRALKVPFDASAVSE